MRRLLPFIVLLTVGLVACGDDGMSTDEYRAEARKVCVDAEKATEAIEQPTRSTPEAIVDYLERLLAANQRTTERFQKLDPPEDLQKPHDDILRANREGADAVRDVIKQLKDGEDPRKVLQSSTSRLRDLGRESNAAAKKLGVPECEQ